MIQLLLISQSVYWNGSKTQKEDRTEKERASFRFLYVWSQLNPKHVTSIASGVTVTSDHTADEILAFSLTNLTVTN